MNLSEKQIEEIADSLNCGFSCFYNLKNGKIVTVPDFDNWNSDSEEFWDDEIKDINNNCEDYFKFDGFDSHESFRLMADFTESLDNSELQDKLINALNRPKPFRNFKWEIDGAGEYRQQWFDFKDSRYIQWIKDQIDVYMNSNEE